MKLPKIKVSVTYDKSVKKSELFVIQSSNNAYEILKTLFDESSIDWVEESVALCLNRANKVIGYYRLSVGGTTGTIIDPKVLFTVALNMSASGIIIAHNHPSGQLFPSDSDRMVTQKIKKAGEYLDITLLDHLIITDEGYYSFADNSQL